jgi:hypothetical protein
MYYLGRVVRNLDYRMHDQTFQQLVAIYNRMTDDEKRLVNPRSNTPSWRRTPPHFWPFRRM